MGDDMQALLGRLTDYSEQNNLAIAKLGLDMQEVREARYKPYITTMGAFLALFITAVGYIYNVEQRLMDGTFALQRSIQNTESMTAINGDRIKTVDDRLAARTRTMAQRWEAHAQLHKEMDTDRRLMAREVLDVVKKMKLESIDH